jgi:protein-tyrosine phosphatase
MSSSTDERHLRFDAVFNFRDLGGYPTRDGRTTRWRTFYRADGLFRMTEADIDTVRALGLRTVLDLRTPDELTERGTFPVGAHPVRFEHLPFLVNHWDPAEAVDDTTSFLVRKYTEMLDEGSASIAAAFAVLADHDAPPAVFHCAAGKDRTGVLAMLLLAVAGVPDEIIGQDYALTAAGMERMMQWYKDNRIGEEVNVM